ncbi:MAG: phosphatase PAP2 family protein [Gemmatimonadota bacterium]
MQPSRCYRSAGSALLLALTAVPLLAQVPDTTKKRPKPDSTKVADSAATQKAHEIIENAFVVRWYHAAAVVGGTVLVSMLDESTMRFVQKHRSNFLDDVSTGFRQEGEPWFYIGTSVGVWGAGVVANSHDLRRAGRRLMAAVALSGISEQLVKQITGRSRPNEGTGAYKFHPFSSLKDSLGVQTRGSFPSGHATAAFAVATSLVEDIRNPIATVLLYTFAAGTMWSRMYDNRHWLSDTVFGAALGITTAKVVSGRWRIFGWKPPSLLVRPTGEVSAVWTVPLAPIAF